MSQAFIQTGAFPLTVGSNDAAFLGPSLSAITQSRSYSPSNTTGVALAEIYEVDATTQEPLAGGPGGGCALSDAAHQEIFRRLNFLCCGSYWNFTSVVNVLPV